MIVQEHATVLANDLVGDGIYVLRLHSPRIAAAVKPAQFVHMRCGEGIDPLLLRPFSVLSVDRALGELSILYQVVGRGSALLAQRKPGDKIMHLGPLGNGFTVRPPAKHLLLVAGGIGIAPLVFLAQELSSQDKEITLLSGARTAARHLPSEFIPPQVEYVLATEDGSAGHHGRVTSLIKEYFPWSDAMYVCGPWPMLSTIEADFRAQAWGWPTRKPIYVSLENQMGCAMGVCLGCVIKTPRGYERVCRDGPVFLLQDLRDEILSRPENYARNPDVMGP
jgi:dihydroorotate dehydrogenase electron transfer subunit